MECKDKKECFIDPIQLGKDLASLEKDMAELQKWSKLNWAFTKKTYRKVRVMSFTLRRHRLVFAGIASFTTFSLLLTWELAKDWIKFKWKIFIGG